MDMVRLSAATDSVLRGIVDGSISMCDGLAAAVRIAARAQARQINEMITAAIERGDDHIDLQAGGGKTWRVHIRQ